MSCKHPFPVRVISLENSVDRHHYVQAQLDGFGLRHSITKGVEGNILSSGEIEKIYDRTTALSSRGKHLHRGEIGCALSHIGLYQEIVNDELEGMCILEDDVNIDPEISSILRGRSNLPRNWDIVFLGCDARRAYLKKFPCESAVSKRLELARALGVGPVKGTYAYLVSHSGAKKLLDSTQTIYKPIDSYLGDLSLLSIYVLTPCIVSHSDNFESTFCLNNRDKRLETKNFENERPLESTFLTRSFSVWISSFMNPRLAALKLAIAYKKLKLSVKYRFIKLYLTVINHLGSKFF